MEARSEADPGGGGLLAQEDDAPQGPERSGSPEHCSAYVWNLNQPKVSLLSDATGSAHLMIVEQAKGSRGHQLNGLVGR